MSVYKTCMIFIAISHLQFISNKQKNKNNVTINNTVKSLIWHHTGSNDSELVMINLYTTT